MTMIKITATAADTEKSCVGSKYKYLQKGLEESIAVITGVNLDTTAEVRRLSTGELETIAGEV